MNKLIFAAVALAAITVPAQAQAANGILIRGTVATVEAVLAEPRTSVRNIFQALPEAGVHTTSGLLAVAGALPGLLSGRPVRSTSTTAVIPLPGPTFLNLRLIDRPNRIAIAVRLSDPLSVLIATGAAAP